MVSWISESLLVSALLAAIVALVCRLFRPRAALCHALWVVVLLKLITPPWVTSPWLPDGLRDILLLRGIPETVAAAPYAGTEISADQRTAPLILRLIGNENPVGNSAMSTEPGNLQWKELLATALLALWVAGALAMAGTQIARLLRFRRLILRGRDSPEWLAREAQRLSDEFHLSLPRLTIVSGLGSALAWTIGHARILIPETLVDAIPANRWPTILAHEFAHLKRKDHWIGWLQLFVGCVWWWNPVFWYSRRQLQEYAEMACDAWVTATLPERRHDYAEALIRVVELASEYPSPAPALGMANRPAAAFERRLNMILRGKMPNRLSIMTAGLVALFALLVVPNLSYAIFQMEANPTPAEVPQTAQSQPDPTSSPAPVAQAAPEPKGSAELENKLDSPISIEFEGNHLAEITKFISDSWEVNIAIDWRVVVPPARPVPADKGKEAPPFKRVPGEKATEAPPVPVPEPGSPDYVTDGMVPFVKIQDVSMRDALTALLRPLNLTFVADRDVIWISSPEKMKEDATHPKPAPIFSDEQILKILAAPVSIEFENIHISEALEFITDSWNVNLVLDSRLVTPPRQSVQEVKMGSTGYITDGIVPQINLKNLSIDQALETVLRPLNLTFTVDRGFIWVSSFDLINAAPLSAEALRPNKAASQEPSQADRVEVLRTFEGKDGICLAQVRVNSAAGRFTGWFKQGDPCGGYTVSAIDSRQAAVTFHRARYNESMSMKAVSGNTVEPDPAGPVTKDWNPPVSLLGLRIVPAGVRAQIQTAAATKWYREGESFERYTLLKISLERQSVTLYDEKSDSFATLSLSPSGGQAPKTS
jgi:beta-lactamase regulating signal transducer with metallopeptidase domain